MRALPFTPLALLFTTAIGCSSTPQKTDPAAAGGNADDIAGAWASACVDPGNGQGFRLTFDFTATDWVLDYDAFADAACATPNLTVHITGSYELGAASSAVAGAREAKFNFGTKTVTPHNDGAAAFLTQACGREGFTIGTAADITPGCAGLGAYPVSTCSSDFDVVKREGEQLRLGARPADNNMCTPDARPKALGLALSRR